MSILVEAGKRRSLSANDVLRVIPDHAGPRLSTPKGGVVHCVRPPETFTFRAAGDVVVVLLAPVRGFQSRSHRASTQVVDASAGAVAIAPAGIESGGEWASSIESLTVVFEPGQLAALAEQAFDLADLHLSPLVFGAVDEHALQVARLLRQELLGSAPNPLYAESLITVLGLHVIRHYSNAASKTKLIKPVGGLAPAAAKRVQEFLEHNVANKVTIAELAAVCDLSPNHFIEAFAKTFGTPPYRYLLDLRLDLAVQLLSQTALPIAEIAYLSGFSSQSHLTSIMRKHRQKTPAQVRSPGK